MPLYEYVCKKCSRRFEAIRPMEDSETAICRHCEILADRVMSVCNAAFGWRPTAKAHEKGNNPYEYERDT